MASKNMTTVYYDKKINKFGIKFYKVKNLMQGKYYKFMRHTPIRWK